MDEYNEYKCSSQVAFQFVVIKAGMYFTVVKIKSSLIKYSLCIADGSRDKRVPPAH